MHCFWYHFFWRYTDMALRSGQDKEWKTRDDHRVDCVMIKSSELGKKKMIGLRISKVLIIESDTAPDSQSK